MEKGGIESRIFNFIQNKASVILLQISPDKIIRAANAFSEEISGKELTGTPLEDFFTGFNETLDIQKLLRKEVHKERWNINTANGLPLTFYFSSLQEDGHTWLIGQMNNLEMEQLRLSMIDLNNELGLLSREVQKKNTQLLQAIELKNEFLGMAAHDLRNPIASIQMFSDFVLETRKETISDELRQILEMIRKSSQYMLSLLDELLEVVKIDHGKLKLEYSLTNLESLLRDCIAQNNILASQKQISIEVMIPEVLPSIEIDPVKIEQVLHNLISNAIKFSYPNTHITVSAFHTEKNIIVQVRDQGQGIPKDELEKIFVPLAKISVKGTAGEKSIGLGLSIVKRIVTGHLGRIWVESEVGKGSSFSFSLPLENTNDQGFINDK